MSYVYPPTPVGPPYVAYSSYGYGPTHYPMSAPPLTPGPVTLTLCPTSGTTPAAIVSSSPSTDCERYALAHNIRQDIVDNVDKQLCRLFESLQISSPSCAASVSRASWCPQPVDPAAASAAGSTGWGHQHTATSSRCGPGPPGGGGVPQLQEQVRNLEEKVEKLERAKENLEDQLTVERATNEVLAADRRKWSRQCAVGGGRLDVTDLLTEDAVRGSIDWTRSDASDSGVSERAHIRQVVTAVCEGLASYGEKGASRDLQADLVEEIFRLLPQWAGGAWCVTAGFHHKLTMHTGAHRSWWLSFCFEGKDFRLLCAWNKYQSSGLSP